MATARELIKRSMQINGVLTKGEVPTGDEAVDGLASMNAMLGSWSNDSLLIYARLSESFALSGGQSTYTIGTGGDFDTDRPLQILSAFLRLGDIDYVIDIISDVDYDRITQKSLSSSIPSVLMYEPRFPLGRITLYPAPTTGTLHIRTEKQLTEIATLDTDLEFPPGWERAIVYNLSMETAGQYGQSIDEATYAIAMDSLSKIKTAVARNRGMDAYPPSAGQINIYTGW